MGNKLNSVLVKVAKCQQRNKWGQKSSITIVNFKLKCAKIKAVAAETAEYKAQCRECKGEKGKGQQGWDAGNGLNWQMAYFLCTCSSLAQSQLQGKAWRVINFNVQVSQGVVQPHLCRGLEHRCDLTKNQDYANL